jgi:hypothetical protein
MDKLQHLQGTMSWFIPVIIILVTWDLIWKLIAMWKAARNNQLGWFICIALVNSAGILPIIYLLIQKNRSEIEERAA